MKNLIFTLLLLAVSTTINSQQNFSDNNSNPNEISSFDLGNMKDVPNLSLVDQYENDIRFYDLIKDKVVALNFIFTTCKTICPPMGANFVALKSQIQEYVDSEEVVMLTISIDPATDTPQRLNQWSSKFGDTKGWTLLTGDQGQIFGLLKKLQVFTALKEEHAPIVLLGREGTDNWVRANGLADPKELAETLILMTKATESVIVDTNKANSEIKDRNYFTNTVLVNQNGKELKFYEDLLKDKIVIINPFFTECKGVCPVMNKNLALVQQHLGEKLGKEVNIISLTVDYKTDNKDVLRRYADAYSARKGWHFLTGEKENIELILSKLGKSVANREAHDSIFLVGNMNTKLWKKVNGLAPIEEIIGQIDSVVDDQQ